MTLDEDLVDELGAAASRQTKHEWLLGRRAKQLDAALEELVSAFAHRGSRLRLTDNVVCNVYRHITRIFSDNDTPIEKQVSIEPEGDTQKKSHT